MYFVFVEVFGLFISVLFWKGAGEICLEVWLFWFFFQSVLVLSAYATMCLFIIKKKSKIKTADTSLSTAGGEVCRNNCLL